MGNAIAVEQIVAQKWDTMQTHMRLEGIIICRLRAQDLTALLEPRLFF